MQEVAALPLEEIGWNWALTAVIFSPLIGVAVLLIMRSDDHDGIRLMALLTSLATLMLAVLATFDFRNAALSGEMGGGWANYHLQAAVSWIGGPGELVDIRYHVGIDTISLFLVLMTALLTPLSIWGSFSGIRDRLREYYILLLLLEVAMLGVFCSMDLLLFYVFFEFTLVPLYFIIGIWGGPEKRRAANKFFIYTLAGSVLTFAGVLYVAYFAYTQAVAYGRVDATFTLNMQHLIELGQSGAIPLNVQWWLFIAFAAGFAIKVPFFPFHTWLPLAHTEAPTAGSVILAGVLLKLGTYGFFRLCLPMLPGATYVFAPFMGTLAVIGIIYGALAAWVQSDVKKLVAYSSVSHLGFCMLGMFSLKMAGATGSVLYMINHGLSTGALFLVVGMLYERYHTREIDQLGGLARPMPWLAFFLIFFTLSSVGLPGLNGFVGEFLVLLGTATSAADRLSPDDLGPGPLGFAYAVPAALGIILSALYMLWMCQRVLFGPRKEPPETPDLRHGLKTDLTLREKGILAPIALACLVLGVYPKPFIETLQPAIAENVFHLYDISGEDDGGLRLEIVDAVLDDPKHGIPVAGGDEAS